MTMVGMRDKTMWGDDMIGHYDGMPSPGWQHNRRWDKNAMMGRNTML